MFKRRKVLAASTGAFALSGCLGGGQDNEQDSQGGDGNDEQGDQDSDGGGSNRPTSMYGVTITDRIFDIRDVNGDGVEDLVFGANFDNINSKEATLSLGIEIQFPDESTASDRGNYYAAPGESTFERGVRLTPESVLLTEPQIEYIIDGEYEYEIWILGVEGVSSGNSDTNESASGQCDPSVILDDSVEKVRAESDADGIYEIEGPLYLTLINLVDFPVDVTATVIFYGEGGATDVLGTDSVSTVLEVGESADYELFAYSAADYSVGLDISCP